MENRNTADIFRVLGEKARQSNGIDPALYDKYHVKKGLRDLNGVGMLAGLTEIGEVIGNEEVGGRTVPASGRLLYRGFDIDDIVANFTAEDRFGFEEVVYLLLFGSLPGKSEMKGFDQLLSEHRNLPDTFVRDNIMRSPSNNVMNTLARSVLTLYSYDDKADDLSLDNIIRQCVRLIACFPLLSVYGYQAYVHFHHHKSMTIHNPLDEAGTAENFLHMLRPGSKFTMTEAKLLDLMLVLHAEHGGGNNSSFITHVATSSNTDTYSVMAAALGSLKGPRHGGSDIRVAQMMDDIKKNVRDYGDDEEIEAYLNAILNKEAFDRTGIIYGIGHAVYSISDPRAEILKRHSSKLAKEKGLEDDMNLYLKVGSLAPKVIAEHRKIYKGVSANIDFYTAMINGMLEIPEELYTPLYAMARIAGWSAHRLEELSNEGKIIRPAYKCVSPRHDYVRMADREDVALL